MANRDNRKYDWDLWLSDSATRVIRHGRDYKCTTSIMAQQVRQAASKRGVSVQVVEIDGGLMIRVKETIE